MLSVAVKAPSWSGRVREGGREIGEEQRGREAPNKLQ